MSSDKSKDRSPEAEHLGWRATSSMPSKKRKFIEGAGTSSAPLFTLVLVSCVLLKDANFQAAVVNISLVEQAAHSLAAGS